MPIFDPTDANYSDDYSPQAHEQRQIFSVANLNQAVRRLLEGHFGQVWLVGEISNFSAPASGHWYFTLKDDKAQVRCAMFRNANQRVQQKVTAGQQVLVRARPGVYEARGDYQLIIEHLEDAGVGLLQQRFEQLKQQLAAAGMFAQARKQALPTQIKRIGIVTSPTGAAIRDVLAVLKRRDPAVEVIIYPVQVQGETAAAQIIQALQRANQRQEVDVVLLTRGGGSLEDLWCFNDEALAHAIAASELPVVSAVGHEVDFTISDFVADVRAATPSAAAELLSQDQSYLTRQLQQQQQRLYRSWQQWLSNRQLRQRHAQQRLQPLHPAQQLQQQQQRVDELRQRLQRANRLRTQQQQQMLTNFQGRLQQVRPDRLIAQQQSQLSQLSRRFQRAAMQQLNGAQQRFSANAQALQLVSPLQTLSRGYSISFDEPSGQVIKSANQVKVGAAIRTKLTDGDVYSTVTAIKSAD